MSNVRILCALLILAAAGITSGCNRAGATPRSELRRIGVLEGFSFPESVRYDARQDVFFVSNIEGYGSEKDGRGYISRVRAGELETIEIFVQSGRNGAVLDAPKGLALQADTLWVADIDRVRGFHRRTGMPVGEVDLSGHDVVMLNDIALGPDGALYVTDSGIIMSSVGVAFPGGSKIFRIAPGRAVSLFTAGDMLRHPNGMTWDSAGKRWVVVTFHPFRSDVYTIAAGGAPQMLAHGPGRFDGIEALSDGRLLVTSWSDSSLHVIDGERQVRAIRDLWQPADPGVDTRRHRVAIPLVLQGRVELWELPRR